MGRHFGGRYGSMLLPTASASNTQAVLSMKDHYYMKQSGGLTVPINNITDLNMKELDLAMNNGYHILMGDITIDDLLSNSSRQKLYISFDPDKLNSNDYWDNIINSMIDYFIETEEYEKCAELKKLL